MLTEEEIRDLIERLNEKIATLKEKRDKSIRRTEERRYEIESGKVKVRFPGSELSGLGFAGIGENLEILSLHESKEHLLFVLGEAESPFGNI